MDKHTISILGDGYFYPISILIEKLIEEEKKSTNSHYVNELSTSICLLSVATLESYIMRIKFIKNNSTERVLPKYFFNTFKNNVTKKELDELTKNMTEIYVLRDLLFHNHVWEELYDPNLGDKVEEHILGGDKKYANHIDSITKKTKKLSLNIIPTEVTYKDVKIVLKTIIEILNFIEKIDNSLVNISTSYVPYQGNQILFLEVIQKL